MDLVPSYFSPDTDPSICSVRSGGLGIGQQSYSGPPKRGSQRAAVHSSSKSLNHPRSGMNTCARWISFATRRARERLLGALSAKA